MRMRTVQVIFKSGDDLRQDQLVIQMVSLMDGLLKRVNLDLKLKPYRILATGPKVTAMSLAKGRGGMCLDYLHGDGLCAVLCVRHRISASNMRKSKPYGTAKG